MRVSILLSKSALSKIAIVAIIVILVVGVAAGVFLSLESLSSTPVKVNLNDALTDKLVEATIFGNGIEYIEITLKSTSNDPLFVNVLRGTIFDAQSTGVQNMVAIQERGFHLESKGSVYTHSVPAACATMELGAPSGNDTFIVSSVSAPEDLIKLVNLSNFTFETFRVKQFAIWTVTDNPTRHGYTGLGYFAFGGTGPSEEEMNRINTLFENAGISTEKYYAFSVIP